MNKPKSVSIIVLVLSILLGLSLLFNGIQATVPSGGPYYLQVPVSTWTYYIGKFSNASCFMVNGSNWKVDYQSLNPSSLVQFAIGNTTTVGGTVYISAGSYAAAVTLKNNVRLILEKGCTGVTVTIDTGATAILEDYENSLTNVYSSGNLVTQYNNLNGAIAAIYGTFTNGAFTNLTSSNVTATTLYVNGENITNNGDCPVSTNSTFTLTSDTSEHTIVTLTPTSVEQVTNFWIDLSALTQNCTLKVWYTLGGTFKVVTSMVVTVGAGSSVLVLADHVIDQPWKLTIQSTVAEGASRSIPYEYFVNVY